MAISGLWKQSVSNESGALKWGTGWNPIHGISTTGPPVRRSATHGVTDQVSNDSIPPFMLGEDPESVDYTDPYWTLETELRPGYDSPTEITRAHFPLGGFPSPGYHQAGLPGGTQFRAEHPTVTNQQKVSEREETVTEGWENKPVGSVEDATTSDPEQYIRQTSMTQRDRIREGSQTSGTASEYSAPIQSRRPTWGQRIKAWSGQRRHYDMEPRVQDEYIRGFLYRNAGTGYPSWMTPNEVASAEPLARQPSPDPYSGDNIPISPSTSTSWSDASTDRWVDAWY